MDVSESVRGLGGDRNRNRDSRVVPLQETMQRDAVDQLHDDVRVSSMGALAEQLRDARVPKAPQQRAFAAEPAAKRCEVLEPRVLILNPAGILVRAQELHGHAALDLQVARFPYLGHPSFADQLGQLVTVLQDITWLHAHPLGRSARSRLAHRQLGE